MGATNNLSRDDQQLLVAAIGYNVAIEVGAEDIHIGSCPNCKCRQFIIGTNLMHYCGFCGDGHKTRDYVDLVPTPGAVAASSPERELV